MSFRLRIFLLVLVVAVTAIGATAWLTFSLTSREVARFDQARERHEASIVAAVHRFGLLNGRWAGIDAVVGRLARDTGLHIRVETQIGQVLTDSDNLEGRAAGPMQLLPRNVAPYPELDPRIVRAAGRLAAASVAAGEAPAAPRRGKDPSGVRLRPQAVPALPGDLFAPAPVTGVFADPAAQALYQLAQYRAALVKMRCVAGRDTPAAPLARDSPPYLDAGQIAAEPACTATAVAEVRRDADWLNTWWSQFAGCRLKMPGLDKCLSQTFGQATSNTFAVPVEVFFGARPDSDLRQLGRPAGLAVAGVVVAAALGTAWIARRVSHPVQLLTGASLQLAAGRLDVRVPDRGQDDLGRLATSFNAMAEALQRSEERQRRLIADVAHELRTPLSNLRGYLEGLADGVIEPDRELFASLHEETLLQRRILDDLQVLALAEAGDLGYVTTEVDLAELAEAAATAHRAVAANAGIELVVDAPVPVLVRADGDRLRQVLGNLLSNAIRYTDAGGRVEIQVDPGAVLRVRDTGAGMTPAEVARAFDRFWRADPARQRATGGSGLGLTIARRIVNDQGGSLDADSTPGLGTTFTVRLPEAPR